MTINIEPTKDHPIPYSEENDKTTSFAEAMVVSGNTADLIEALGTPPEISKDDALATINTLKEAVKSQDPKKLNTPPVAFAAREFLRVYSGRLAMEVADVRSALTNRLLEIAGNDDVKVALKAIELLGKHSDIALFTERSEVTVNYKTSNDLESAIKDRIKRLMNAEKVSGPSVSDIDVDDVLGIVDMPREKPTEEGPDVT